MNIINKIQRELLDYNKEYLISYVSQVYNSLKNLEHFIVPSYMFATFYDNSDFFIELEWPTIRFFIRIYEKKNGKIYLFHNHNKNHYSKLLFNEKSIKECADVLFEILAKLYEKYHSRNDYRMYVLYDDRYDGGTTKIKNCCRAVSAVTHDIEQSLRSSSTSELWYAYHEWIHFERPIKILKLSSFNEAITSLDSLITKYNNRSGVNKLNTPKCVGVKTEEWEKDDWVALAFYPMRVCDTPQELRKRRHH